MIAGRIYEACGLPNCVGIIDGTLFPLAFRPQTEDAPDYKGRKYSYSISGIIVCDDRRYIRYYEFGWPGCAHDNRIARNCDMWRSPNNYFEDRQYIMGDSAFENKWFMVSAFSSPAGQAMSMDKSLFNKHLSKVRVISEHTIGLLKGRFQWLRSVRMMITEDPRSMQGILQLLDVSIILHNYLLGFGDREIVESWIDDDDITAVDAPDRLPPDDELNLPVPDGVSGDFRRAQLLHYLLDDPAC